MLLDSPTSLGKFFFPFKAEVAVRLSASPGGRVEEGGRFRRSEPFADPFPSRASHRISSFSHRVIAALPEATAIAQLLMSANSTVLAPSNAAFATALNFTDTTLNDTSALDLDLLYNVITYHVLTGT